MEKPQISFSEKIKSLKEKMKNKVFHMVFELRSKGNVPFKISVNISRNLQNLVEPDCR